MIVYFFFISTLLLQSCTITEYLLEVPKTPESAECKTNTPYSGNTVITGTAGFYKRMIKSKSGKYVLGNPISTPLPIRYAEIQVLDSTGAIVQCGKTDGAGDIKAYNMSDVLQIPDKEDVYTVRILARTNIRLPQLNGKTTETYFNVSVKQDIYSNAVHSMSSTITTVGPGSYAIALNAAAVESGSAPDYFLPGGAFNIYNNVLTTYEYINSNTGNTDITCMNNRLNVYWKAGFNPAQYINPKANIGTLPVLSFYNRGYKELFISGGRNGYISNQDTDHFDDTVIIHEVGHYVEDACGAVDSPGDAHYGMYRGDPRLMWSEGWGNFFGVHILRNAGTSLFPGGNTGVLENTNWTYYLDTKGYDNASTSSGEQIIRVNLSLAGNNPESFLTADGNRYYDKVDSLNNPGEGHFRELSISRSLFKGTNTKSLCTLCKNQDNFSNYWLAFERRTAGNGMGKDIYPFRSSVRFWNRLFNIMGSSAFATIDEVLNSDEAQQRDTTFTSSTPYTWVPYGAKLVKSGTCSINLSPRKEDLTTGTFTNYADDQRFSSHFFMIDPSTLSSVTNIKLTLLSNVGTTLDLDLILYPLDYDFDEDCVGYTSEYNKCTNPQKAISSQMIRYDRKTGNTGKTISIAGLTVGQKYLLVVKAYTMKTSSIAAGTTYNYTLTDQTGAHLCPQF